MIGHFILLGVVGSGVFAGFVATVVVIDRYSISEVRKKSFIVYGCIVVTIGSIGSVVVHSTPWYFAPLQILGCVVGWLIVAILGPHFYRNKL